MAEVETTAEEVTTESIEPGATPHPSAEPTPVDTTSKFRESWFVRNKFWVAIIISGIFLAGGIIGFEIYSRKKVNKTHKHHKK
jgi:hypothetical protein